MFPTVLHILSFGPLTAVVGGGSESPLSTNSTLTELLRLLVPLNSAALLYLVQRLKSSTSDSGDTHTIIIKKLDSIEGTLSDYGKRLDKLDGEQVKTAV